MNRISEELVLMAEVILADLPVRKWVSLNSGELKNYREDIFKLIQIAYQPIGGHFEFKSPGDVNTSDVNVWRVIDLDGNDSPNAVMFGKTRNGVKFTGIGHDGTSDAKREVLTVRNKLMKGGGYWSEMSGKLAEIFLKNKKYQVPYISDPKTVQKLLPGKEIEWVGEIPGFPGIDGWYKRKIGGSTHLKIILGSPKSSDRKRDYVFE